MISSTPIFAAADIEATIEYYKTVLGFDNTWKWDDPPTFGGASLGGVSLMFCLQPELAKNVKGHQHWIKVENADELYEKHKASNAKIVEEIGDRPWNAREYVVEDINGYYLRIAGPPKGEVAQSQAFPKGVTIERRKPTLEEFTTVAGQAFGHRCDSEEALALTWNGVVALAPSGEAIGVLRIVYDAPGWFSVWDVAVLPDWQAKRIGTRMMKEATEMVHEASPGAFVFLFTFKHGFYEKLGFNQETVSIKKV
jgi:ribosomal protein S18 acetylase RimI-like enzyme